MPMMKIHIQRSSLFFLLFSLFGLFQASAQSSTPIWANKFQSTGDNSDRLYKIAPAGNGDFVATGYTTREGNYRDIFTVKLNSAGDSIWSRSWNGLENGNDEASLVITDVLGNTYVAGFTDAGNKQDDIVLLKYDANGTLLWDTTWNSSAYLDDYPTGLALDGNANVLICGIAEPDTITGSNDYITLKIAPSGGLLWQNQYSRPTITGGKDEANAIVVDASGNVYVTGRSSNGLDDDFVTIKYDGNTGTALWTQLYNSGNGDDRAADIALDNAGNVVVVGRNDNGNNDDIRILKYSAAGILQWSRFYNGPSNQNDRGLKITTDLSNNVYVAGQTDVNTTIVTNYDFVVLKYNSSGTVQWARTEGYAALQNDIPNSIAVDASGRVFATGRSDQDPDPLVTNDDCMTVAFDAAGTKLWTNYVSGSGTGGNDEGFSLVVDNTTGELLLAGGSENNGTQKDGLLVRYQAAGSEVWKKEINGEGDLSSSARSMVVDVNNRVYYAGYVYIEDDERDALIAAVDNNGQPVCSIHFNGSNDEDDEFQSIGVDGSGFIYATGYTKSLDRKSDFFTVKWNPFSCDTVWTRTYNHSSNQSDRAESLVVDAAGNVYVTGRSDQDPNDTLDNNDIVTIKYDSNGNQLWLQRYNGTGNLRDEPAKIMLDNSGHVLVCGRTENIQNDDFIVLKYDPVTGNPSWAAPAVYNGPFSNDDRALDMTVDASNNIFVCGYSQTSSGNATDDAAIVKFDAGGNFVSFFPYDGLGLGNDQAVGITHDQQDNIYAILYTDDDISPLVSNYDYLTIKFDNNLNQLWGTPPIYNSPVNGDDYPVSISVNGAGDVYVTGTSEYDTTGGRVNQNWATIRYNSSGQQSWVANYDGSGNRDDSPNALTLRGNALWVAGFSISSGIDQKDATVLRYDLSTGIADGDGLQTEAGLRVFPNPAHGIANLQADASAIGSVLMIYNSNGQLVLEQKITAAITQFDSSVLPAGIYQCMISQNGSAASSIRFIVQ